MPNTKRRKAKGKGRARSKRRQSGGKIDLQKWINKLGVEFHWPGYLYMGPGTKLAMRLKRGDLGINRLDKLAKQHDIDYSEAKNLADKHKADRKMITENTPNSWKNRLSSLIALDKDWEVGMSSISLPPESRLKKYLNNLPDATRLLTTKRRVNVVVTQQLDVIATYVHYSDIKDKPLGTLHDLLRALFEVEREKFILNLGESGVLANEMPTRKFPNLQFDVTFDDALETCTVCAKKIIPDTLSNNDNDSLVWNPGKKQLQWDSIYNEEEGTIKVTSEEVDDSVFSSRLNFKFHCHFVLRKDMCDLFGWTKYTKYQSTIIAKHGPNLVMRKRDNAFFEDRTDSQHYGYRYGLLEAVVQGKDGAYDMNNFYMTLPSNDGSVEYFPGNTNNSGKNRLNKRLDLEGEYEVGMSSISLPPESLLIPYLKGLNDGSIMMRTFRMVYRSRGNLYRSIVTRVEFGDLKHRRMETGYDLLKALFEAEWLKFLDQLQNYDSIVYPGNKPFQFDTIFNEREESFTLSPAKVSEDLFRSFQHLKDNVNLHIRKDLCQLFEWVQNITYDGKPIYTNGPNLVLGKRGNKFTESRNPKDSSYIPTRYGLSCGTMKGSDNVVVDSIIFCLHEFTHTFIRHKESTYKNNMAPRTLYLYSSLCAPVIMVDQTTDLLRTFQYRPLLKGSYYYEPKHIHYIALRNEHIDKVETQLRESENNNLAQFT
ncbi:hypothetical protein AWC38_SpisGene24065 [Stylophora pistillata]|uniref:Phospholipase A2-like domain-containing protein n=1 Tax=Stylophora pistillata TaxID=50429 RepID=A0A2B4R4F8_STYPI|nr:hypothetical protein AWC38_SpisGene24065 [Stylophora pistillata]